MDATLGDRLRDARLKAGLTQAQLAKLVGAPSHTTICDYETGKRGKRRPDILMLVKVCEILKVSIDYLFLGKKTKN